ncbi:MAG: four-carbon acid sugar kinase family protein, partial [Nocardioides sp.]
NAAAAGFARAGMRAATAGTATRPDVVAEMAPRFDVVVASTDSRHVPSLVARERVAAAVRAGWPSRLVCNRIDTTLRGNIGATVEALRDEVARLSGKRTLVLLAPAHPEANRHTIGGTQLLDGRRLEDTELARDARHPMRTSDIVSILAEQTGMAAAVIPLASIVADADELADGIRREVDAGAEILVADATTLDHLDRIAEAVLAATRDLDVVWVSADPGPGSVALARAMHIEPHSAGAPLLVVSGSATELTRSQLSQLRADTGAGLHLAPGRDRSRVPDVDDTTMVLDRALKQAGVGDVIVLATALSDEDVRPVTLEEADEIPRALARAVRRNLEEHRIDGLLTTGGDVTAAVLAELGSHGLEITGEVVPLAVSGSLVGGPWDGLPIVTKGGLVGDARTTTECVEQLRRSADVHRRQVSSAEPRSPW